MTTLQVGTRITGGPYHDDGIVTAVHAVENSNSFMIGRGLQPIRELVDIIWTSHESKREPAAIFESLPYRIRPGLADAAEIAAMRATCASKQAEAKAKADEATIAFAAAKVRLEAEYPYLLRADKGGSLTQAAKNIRILLARAFPGVKFSVRTSRFSGGNDLRVSWTDGPNSEQVKKIAEPFAGGHFDGMTDMYEYSRSPWTELFGEAKYVSCDRDYSDKMVAAIIGRVARELGGLDREPTVEDYRQGRLWSIKQSGGCDYSREVNSALARHTYCIAKG